KAANTERYIKPANSLKCHGLLYAKAPFTEYKRDLRNQHENHVILNIERTRRKEHGHFYIGELCVYVYKTQTRKCAPQHPERNTKLRAVYGKATRFHGCVRAHFIFQDH
uniref:Large ribosomal subunit protein eL33 n=1 Tax=Megaselia scalaris TaxID=36166 RepID=T1H6H3_MEGSC